MRHSLLILAANAMAAFLDFGIGCFIAGFFGVYFSVELQWYHLIIGGILALLPDADLIPSVLRGKTTTFDHRQTLFHRPILMLPLATFIAYKLGGELWAVIAFVSVLWHYCHDTDWFKKRYGIAWFWPLSKRFWSFVGSYNPPLSTPLHAWLLTTWLVPSRQARVELSIGALMLFLALQLIDLPSSVAASLIFLLALARLIVWKAAQKPLPVVND